MYRNEQTDKLAPIITVSNNSLGFRGPEPPSEPSLSIFAVGGSTTRSYYNTDGSSWPDLVRHKLRKQFPEVGIWLNNAGMSGHSTFGHLVLLRQYILPLRPSIVLFLVGLNDVGQDRPAQFGLADPLAVERSLRVRLKTILMRHLELPGFVANIRGLLDARARDIEHNLRFNVTAQSHFREDVNERQQLLHKHSSLFVPKYEERVRRLVELCRADQVLPILITQPALYGPATDRSTGVSLGSIRVGSTSGSTAWDILELYNATLRRVARDSDTPLIDLARSLPKDSQYFYDLGHLSDKGAEAVAEVLAADLVPILRERCASYDGRLTTRCNALQRTPAELGTYCETVGIRCSGTVTLLARTNLTGL